MDCENCDLSDKHTKILCVQCVQHAYSVMMRHYPKVPAVYMLMDKNVGVYVGYTSNFWSRVRDHLQQGKVWDSVMYTAFATPELARQQELDILSKCKQLPKYNRSRTH